MFFILTAIIFLTKLKSSVILKGVKNGVEQYHIDGYLLEIEKPQYL